MLVLNITVKEEQGIHWQDIHTESITEYLFLSQKSVRAHIHTRTNVIHTQKFVTGGEGE